MTRPVLFENFPVYGNGMSGFPGSVSLEEGGIIPVDKPIEWTSFDVVKFVRRRIGIRKTGHAGTLDPLATGLLILCFGRATRSISRIQEMEKTYLAEITFGGTTPSFDAGTPVVESAPWEHLTVEMLEELIRERFSGVIQQVPPVYSALKKEGRRLYELARKGVDVEPESRPVELHEIRIVEADFPRVRLLVRCGKGFYVRSLANDLARAAGTLGYLSFLRRTAIGIFDLSDAWNIESIREWDE